MPTVTTTGAGGEVLVLDPFTESTSNAPLWLHSPMTLRSGVMLAADGGHQYPMPDADVIWVSSPDTEGDLLGNTRPSRRSISITALVVEPVDVAATNKATNPVAATGSTGWTNNSLTAMTAGVYQAVDPTLPFLRGFDTGLHATGNADDDSAYLTAAVTSGVAETFSAWVYVVSGAVRLEVWNASPALNTNSANITVGSWQRVVLPYTPTTTASYTFRVAQNGAGTSDFWVTGVQIGPADPYFDGDLAGCYWSGTRHASTSVRRAPGGPRYAGIKSDVESKIAKLNEVGGTLRRTLPTGEHIIFDVQQARVVQWQEDPVAELWSVTRAELDLTCKPYGRGVDVTV